MSLIPANWIGRLLVRYLDLFVTRDRCVYCMVLRFAVVHIPLTALVVTLLHTPEAFSAVVQALVLQLAVSYVFLTEREPDE